MKKKKQVQSLNLMPWHREILEAKISAFCFQLAVNVYHKGKVQQHLLIELK